MPLLHLRVCTHCDRVRFAPCSTTCRAPNPTDPDNWRPNLQQCAETIKETP